MLQVVKAPRYLVQIPIGQKQAILAIFKAQLQQQNPSIKTYPPAHENSGRLRLDSTSTTRFCG